MSNQQRQRGRRVPPKTEHLDPGILQHVMKLDRDYFEQHPDATEYTRPYIEGESIEPCESVIIYRVRPGQRGRLFVSAANRLRAFVIDFDADGGAR